MSQQKCPYCKSRTRKFGFNITVGKGRRQRRQCIACGRSFYAKPDTKTRNIKAQNTK